MTEWNFPATSFLTVSGVAATRVSPGRISVGMPIRIDTTIQYATTLSYHSELMDLGLRDKVAIVTGSSRGLGLASACALAAEGCLVCVCARNELTLEHARRDVAVRAVGEERVAAVAADVSTPHGVKAVIDGAMSAFGGIDILVNNVGLARGATLVDTSDAEWQEAFDQTLFPAIRASRLAVPHMKQ